MKSVAAVVILSLLPLGIAAQDDCALRLVEAQTLFERGQVERVSSVLMNCLQSGGFSREDELQAYRLLIQSLLLDEKFDSADEAMVAFLRRFPEYEVTSADYPGFVYLKSTYQVKPVVMVSLNAGFNHTAIYSRTINTISSQTPDLRYKSQPLSLFAGGEVRIPVSGSVQIAAGAAYSSISFGYEENILGFGRVTYSERLSRMEVPVTAIFNTGSWRGLALYGRGGAGVAFNLGSEANAAFLPTDLNNFFTRTGETLNRGEARRATDLFIQLGAGAALKVLRGYITTELRLIGGITNQSVASRPGTLEYFYFHTDDRFRIGVAGITAGYTYIFYRPFRRDRD